MQRRELPEGWDAETFRTFPADEKGMATRKASGEALNAVARSVPWLVGGAADSEGSTSVGLTLEGAGVFSADDRGGRYIHFGIREHGMACVVNGLSLSKLRPYGSTYLIFSDYAREPIRLSALMEIPAIWIFTHDSIGLGEDGPTHQPVEQLAVAAGDAGSRHDPALRRERGGRGVACADEVPSLARSRSSSLDRTCPMLDREPLRVGGGPRARGLRARRPC